MNNIYIRECLIELINTTTRIQNSFRTSFIPRDIDDIREMLDKIQEVTNKLLNVDFEKLKITDNSKNELANYARELNQHMGSTADETFLNSDLVDKSFKKFSSKAEMILSLENQALSNKENAWQLELARLDGILREQYKKLSLNESSLARLQASLPSQMKEIASSTLEQAKENIAIDKTIAKTAGKQIRILSKRESKSACYWVISGIVCIFIALFYAGYCMKLNMTDYIIDARSRNGFNENIQIALLFKEAFKSIFIVSVLSSLSFMCFKQYKLHRRNHVLYEHKYFAMNAFNAFMSNSILSDTRNIIVDKAMDSIFKNPDFLDHPSNDAHERSGDIIQTIKTALPSSENK